MQSIPRTNTPAVYAPTPNTYTARAAIRAAAELRRTPRHTLVEIEQTITELTPPAAAIPRGLPGVREIQCDTCGRLIAGPRAGWTPTRPDENGDPRPLRIEGPQLTHAECSVCAQRRGARHHDTAHPSPHTAR